MSYQSCYDGYQSTPGGDSSNEYNKLASIITSNIQKISQNVSGMQRMVNQLGTSSDSDTLKKQLNDTQHFTNELAKETSNLMKELSCIAQPVNISEQKQRRVLKDRLTQDFSDVLKNLQVIQRTSAQKQKESVLRARANSGLDSSLYENTSQNPNLIDLQSPASERQQITLQMEADCNIEMLREREKAINNIENDILAVNQIFKDLASLIHEQGGMVDNIEANVEDTQVRVAEAAQSIAKTREYQTKSRRHKCFLTLSCAIIFFFLLFIIWLVKD